jgi:hypothetical protein
MNQNRRTVSRFSLEAGMTYIDEFRSDHDRSMKRLLARLALYADEPFPKTDADCRRLIATRGRLLASWQLDTLKRWCRRQNRA